jgi:hypothetical protein
MFITSRLVPTVLYHSTLKEVSPDVHSTAHLINGRLDGFSTERLLRFLNDLGCDVRISISAPHPETRGQVVFS